MKINFFGTDIFASIILQGLIDAGFDISCVVTKPDMEVGRKKEIVESKISILAKKFNIPVEKPIKLKGFEDILSKYNGDINVVCEYGKIIPDSVLYLPKFKSVNIHGSILPQYRGASPIQFSLLNDDYETGVTLMEMDHEMDHGNIISIRDYPILDTDTEPILREKLAGIGSSLLIEELKKLEIEGKFSNSIPQDHEKATYTRLIEKQDGLIDVSLHSSDFVISKYKAFITWPGIFINYKGKKIRLTDIDFLDSYNIQFDRNNNIFPFVIKDKALYLICSDDCAIKINRLQFESKNEISDKDFINQVK